MHIYLFVGGLGVRIKGRSRVCDCEDTAAIRVVEHGRGVCDDDVRLCFPTNPFRLPFPGGCQTECRGRTSLDREDRGLELQLSVQFWLNYASVPSCPAKAGPCFLYFSWILCVLCLSSFGGLCCVCAYVYLTVLVCAVCLCVCLCAYVCLCMLACACV